MQRQREFLPVTELLSQPIEETYGTPVPTAWLDQVLSVELDKNEHPHLALVLDVAPQAAEPTLDDWHELAQMVDLASQVVQCCGMGRWMGCMKQYSTMAAFLGVDVSTFNRGDAPFYR